MKQTQWHSSKGNSCRQMTLTKQKLLLEILYTLYVATKTSRIPRKAKRIFLGGNFLFRISEYTQREKKCSFRKLQILISQTTDFHFANYRFPFRKLQIPISQTTDFHFHFVSSHFVSHTTVSPMLYIPFLISTSNQLQTLEENNHCRFLLQIYINQTRRTFPFVSAVTYRELKETRGRQR